MFSSFIFSSFLNAQVKYSNEFLSIGVGARAFGMSHSIVALSDDITSTYWNPAGLVLIPNNLQIGLMHSEYFAGIAKYDYVAGAFKINEQSSFGVSGIRFGVDDIPNTLELIDKDGNIRYDRIKSFSVADYGFLFSYARKAPIEGLRYGGNVKIIRRIAGDFASAWGFGIDASAQYDYGKWKFGVLARDVTSTFNVWSFNTEELVEAFTMTGNEIPENSLEITLPKLIMGAARSFDITEQIEIAAEIDLDWTFDGKRNVLVKSDPVSIDPHLGFEANYKKIVFLRGGIGNFQLIKNYNNKNDFSLQPNIGVGFKWKNFALDYAFANLGGVSIAPYSNIISLKYAIDKK
ncbi:MAG TPA: hypothetical protein DEH02_20775 [Bacteroidales bacterium]|nr:hypothetical protein [Bacteroidales bacterium]